MVTPTLSQSVTPKRVDSSHDDLSNSRSNEHLAKDVSMCHQKGGLQPITKWHPTKMYSAKKDTEEDDSIN